MADVAFLTDPFQVYPLIGGVPRSPQWPAVERKFKESHPECECCGTKSNLQVHHKQPYHEHPELELDEDNLMTACRYCHFVLCHENNWANVVEDVVVQANTHRRRVERHRKKLVEKYGFDAVIDMEIGREFHPPPSQTA